MTYDTGDVHIPVDFDRFEDSDKMIDGMVKKRDKFATVQEILDKSFDFRNSTIHPQAAENLKKYLDRKNAKSN